MKWIVENFTKEPSYLELVEAIKKLGMELKEIKGEGYKPSDLDDCRGWPRNALFLGSIEMTKIIKQELSPGSYPLVYCDFEKYLCTKYMSHFASYLFNDRYAFTTLAELQRQKFFYYGMFGKEALFFIRPDSGEKPFAAQLVDLLYLDDFVDQYKHLKHELIVVSSPKEIRWEGRFIVNKERGVIGHSTYKFQNQITKIPSVPLEAKALAEEMLQKVDYYPDPVFCMDLCQDHDGKFWLLELNSFSSAGLYASDKTQVAKVVSEIAEEDFKKHRAEETAKPLETIP